jgi:hypothetical protein
MEVTEMSVKDVQVRNYAHKTCTVRTIIRPNIILTRVCSTKYFYCSVNFSNRKYW